MHTPRPRRARFVKAEGPAPADERLWVSLKPGVYGTGRVTFPVLPPGMYGIGLDDDLQLAFEARDPKVDDLLRFPDSLAKTILEEIDAFWRLGETFARHGFLHRRGYLLYGPHGSGKSSVVQQIIADILEREGIVFLCGEPEQLARARRARSSTPAWASATRAEGLLRTREARRTPCGRGSSRRAPGARSPGRAPVLSPPDPPCVVA